VPVIGRSGARSLSPRVLALAADPRLVELLLRLEDHEEEWRTWTVTTHEWGAPTSFARREAAATLDVAASIYEHLEKPERVALVDDHHLEAGC
jgi:hypothetical protein